MNTDKAKEDRAKGFPFSNGFCSIRVNPRESASIRGKASGFSAVP